PCPGRPRPGPPWAPPARAGSGPRWSGPPPRCRRRCICIASASWLVHVVCPRVPAPSRSPPRTATRTTRSCQGSCQSGQQAQSIARVRVALLLPPPPPRRPVRAWECESHNRTAPTPAPSVVLRVWLGPGGLLLLEALAAGVLEPGKRLMEAVERVQVGPVRLRLGRLRLAQLRGRGRAQAVALACQPQRPLGRLAVPLLQERRPVRRHQRTVGRLHLGPELQLGRTPAVARILGRSTRLLDLPLTAEARKDRHADVDAGRERLPGEAERKDVVALQYGRTLRVRQRVARKTVGRRHGRVEPPQDLVRLL